MNRKKKLKILITGHQDFKSKNKVIEKMQQIVNGFDDLQKVSIATFNSQFGPQKTAYKYCMKKEIPIKFFTQSDVFFVPSNPSQVNIILYDKAVQWADVIIIFANFYTFKIKKIIENSKRTNKDCIIIKE